MESIVVRTGEIVTSEPENVLPALTTQPFVATATGLVVAEGGIPIEAWKEFGKRLGQVKGAMMWNLGDWLNYGEVKYGETYQKAKEDTGYSTQTLWTAKCVAADFESCSRLQDLSWGHHHAVASLESPEREEWLEKALEGDGEKKWSRDELRRKLRAHKLLSSPPLPDDKYNLIYADPPWRYGREGVQGYGDADVHYATLEVQEMIEKFDVENLADDNAVLFLWATSPLIENAFELIQGWGFTYKAMFIWDKVKHNMGHYNSIRHELLLLCLKGSFPPESNELHDSVIEIDRTETHSEKPEYFRQLIESMYPSAKKIELFARSHHEGWQAWGKGI